jgi:hypothetical protein
MFRSVLKQILLTMVNSIAIDPQDRKNVNRLIAEIDDNADIVDTDGDGIPDAIDGDVTPPRGFVVNAGEPSFEELLTQWRAADAKKKWEENLAAENMRLGNLPSE